MKDHIYSEVANRNVRLRSKMWFYWEQETNHNTASFLTHVNEKCSHNNEIYDSLNGTLSTVRSAVFGSGGSVWASFKTQFGYTLQPGLDCEWTKLQKLLNFSARLLLLENCNPLLPVFYYTSTTNIWLAI